MSEFNEIWACFDEESIDYGSFATKEIKDGYWEMYVHEQELQKYKEAYSALLNGFNLIEIERSNDYQMKECAAPFRERRYFAIKSEVIDKAQEILKGRENE